LLSSNEGRVLTQSALADNGIVLISHYLVEDALRSGKLQPVLTDFPIPELWVKAAVPERRIDAIAVQALLRTLKNSLSQTL
jgi:DNA-binding transcriptional LysR family regulator